MSIVYPLLKVHPLGLCLSKPRGGQVDFFLEEVEPSPHFVLRREPLIFFLFGIKLGLQLLASLRFILIALLQHGNTFLQVGDLHLEVVHVLLMQEQRHSVSLDGSEVVLQPPDHLLIRIHLRR